MNSFYEYFAARQKLAAYRQAKRLQRGVRLGYNQSPTADSATKFTGGAVPIGVGDFSVEYFGNSYGSGAYPFLSSVSETFSCRSASVGQNGVSSIIVGDSDDPIPVGWAAQSSESRFYLAVTRSGATVNVYINGELKATKEQSEVKDLCDLQLAIANSSDVGFVRVWNMCLSADEIASLYNNGDPMGYVVPKASRYFERSYHSNFTEGTDGWIASSQSPNLSITSDNSVLSVSGDYSDYYLRLPSSTLPKYASRYKFRIEFEEPITASRFQLFAYSADTSYGEFLTEPQNILEGVTPTSRTGIPNTNVFFYLYGLIPNTVVRIKSISIEPVGLIAEYLPQNLMYGRDEKTIGTSWLDSAKQLPLSDEYMEPLFQSIGGYDMAANGAPEILYNE